MLKANKHKPKRHREKVYYKGERLYSRTGSNHELALRLEEHRQPTPPRIPLTILKWLIPRDEYNALEWLRARPNLGKIKFTIGSRLGIKPKIPYVHKEPTCDSTLEEKLKATLARAV